MEIIEKKTIITSYIDGVKDTENGASFTTIMRYFIPEFISAFVLYSVLNLLDAKWIADLKSTSTYATLGVTNTLLHMVIKIAEGMSVGAVVLGGQFNGAGDFKKVGRTLTDTFWLSTLIGGIFFIIFYFGAAWIYQLFGVPDRMAQLGVPFLRLRALGVFFMFLYFAFIGFLRSIKNTRIPMIIFVLGAIVFVFFDYALIFGKFGFPAMRLRGSALATVIQYGFMLFLAMGYVLLNKEYHKFGIRLLVSVADFGMIKRLISLSWRVVLDKATMAASYIWLGKMIAPLGKYAIASFAVIKDMERFAILPAVAFAQIITFMVSNDLGAANWIGIKNNVKKSVFISTLMVFVVLFVFTLNPTIFIQFFDKKGTFITFSSEVFPILSVLIFFDLLQLVLSGALRGAENVNFVMWTRFIVCGCFFVPVTYFFSLFPMHSAFLKFCLIYGTFFMGNAIMSTIYINRFRSGAWKNHRL